MERLCGGGVVGGDEIENKGVRGSGRELREGCGLRDRVGDGVVVVVRSAGMDILVILGRDVWMESVDELRDLLMWDVVNVVEWGMELNGVWVVVREVK